MVQATIKSVQDSGLAAARGQRGRSASATQQAVLSSFAFDTAKISDALYRSKESLELERQQIAAQQRGIGRQRGILNQKEDLSQDRLSLAIEKLDSNDIFAQAGRDMAVSQSLATRDLTNQQARDTLNLTESQTEDTLDLTERQAEENRKQTNQQARASRDLSISQADRNRRLADNQAKQSRDREIASERRLRNLQNRQTKQQFRQTRNQAQQASTLSQKQTEKTRQQETTQRKEAYQQQIDQISKTFGIDKKVFEMNKTRLGEELISAAQARSTAISEISRGLVQANISTNAQRMLSPEQFSLPDPPRPPQAEMPKLVPPTEPDAVSRESYQVPKPPEQSGTSKILGGLGMVAGVVATVATAGAALPGVAAATASTLGTVGTVAGGVSQGLGLIGKYTQ